MLRYCTQYLFWYVCSDDGGRSAVHWAAEVGLLPSLMLLLQACGEEQSRQLAAYRAAGVSCVRDVMR